jgi:hypothetical protein
MNEATPICGGIPVEYTLQLPQCELSLLTSNPSLLSLVDRDQLATASVSGPNLLATYVPAPEAEAVSDPVGDVAGDGGAVEVASTCDSRWDRARCAGAHFRREVRDHLLGRQPQHDLVMVA